MKGNVLICEKCGSKKNEIVVKKERLNVRGKEIEIEAKLRVCICGNELFDEQLEEDNLMRAYDLFRKEYQLLSPQEIRVLREKYELPQRTLGKILGWGEVTIHRYETGALPDASHHKMLRLLDNPEVMKKLLIESKDIIPKTTFRRAMEKIHTLLEEQENEEFIDLLRAKFEHTSVDIESGFRQFDFNKFINVVLFFAQNVSQLWKTKLNKLLFYSDFKHFREFTVSLMGAKYIKLEFGPVPKDYEALLWGLETMGFIKVNPTEVGNDYTGYLIQPLADYDPDMFTEEELALLHQIVQRYGDYSSAEISEVSHKESAWLKTPFAQVISYKHALELNH